MFGLLTTTQAVTIVTLISMMFVGGESAARNKVTGEDGKWMEPMEKYGWNVREIQNQVKDGEVTTYELGKPNYQILNPEDQPEFITEDQPHYHEMLRRLTGSGNTTDTIDMGMPSASSSAGLRATAMEEPRRRPMWEKLRKRSNPEEPKCTDAQEMGEIEAIPLERRVRQPKIQVYNGARPFQKLIANLS